MPKLTPLILLLSAMVLSGCGKDTQFEICSNNCDDISFVRGQGGYYNDIDLYERCMDRCTLFNCEPSNNYN